MGCGGGSPSGPTQPSPPPPGSPVSGYLYYDENGNGVADAGETVRFPSVTVAVGPRTGQTTPGGRFTIADVPHGSQAASAQASTLPAYFAAPSVAVTVPLTTGELAVPATLAIGPHARPNFYMAFGDSITVGDGSSGGGYPDYLAADLRSHWGRAEVVNEGVSGTKSDKGDARMERSLSRARPAWVLIMYGTNDYNDGVCRNDPPCYTIDALRSMIFQTREVGAWPVLATIPPVNPAFTDRDPVSRNAWVSQMNDRIRTLATQERIALADIHRDFLRQPSLQDLYADFLHPNDRGYQVMARSFFDAITRPVGTTGSRRKAFGFGF